MKFIVSKLSGSLKCFPKTRRLSSLNFPSTSIRIELSALFSSCFAKFETSIAVLTELSEHIKRLFCSIEVSTLRRKSCWAMLPSLTGDLIGSMSRSSSGESGVTFAFSAGIEPL